MGNGSIKINNTSSLPHLRYSLVFIMILWSFRHYWNNFTNEESENQKKLNEIPKWQSEDLGLLTPLN